MQHRIAFSRNQRVNCYSRRFCNFFERKSLQFSQFKYRSLFRRQFGKSSFQFFPNHRLQQCRFGVVALVGKQSRNVGKKIPVIINEFGQALFFLLAVAVDNLVASRRIKPRRNLLYRICRKVNLTKIVEDIMQNVLYISNRNECPPTKGRC